MSGHLGIFQKQIVAVEEGSPDTLPAQSIGGDPLINFAKRRRLSEIIRKIQTYQSGAYAFAPHGATAKYIAPRLKKWEAELLEGSLVGDATYKGKLESIFDKASLRCEPRKSKTAPAIDAGAPSTVSTLRRGSVDSMVDALNAVGGSAPNLLSGGGTWRPTVGPRRGSMP